MQSYDDPVAMVGQSHGGSVKVLVESNMAATYFSLIPKAWSFVIS